MNSTGGKSIFDPKESVGMSITNFTAKDSIFIKNKKVKNKKLPSLMDDSKISPRNAGQVQYSTDFTLKKRNGPADPLGGYETDFTTGNQFNSTYDDGFGGAFESTTDDNVQSTYQGTKTKGPGDSLYRKK